MGVFLEHRLYAGTLGYGVSVPALSRNPIIRPVGRHRNPAQPDIPDLLRAHAGKFRPGGGRVDVNDGRRHVGRVRTVLQLTVALLDPLSAGHCRPAFHAVGNSAGCP